MNSTPTPTLFDELTATERQKWAHDAEARSELIRSLETRLRVAEQKLALAVEGLRQATKSLHYEELDAANAALDQIERLDQQKP